MKLPTLALPALVLGLGACNNEAASPADPAAESAAPVAKIAPPAGKSWAETVAVTPGDGYLMGNPEAPIKLLEYGSLTCSHCAEFSEKGYAKLRDDYVGSGRVSYEFRNFSLNGLDIPLAMLTRCGSPESYFALTEQVYANQPALLERSQQGLAQAEAAAALPENQRFVALAQALGFTEFFAQRGIATDQANACLARGETAKQIAAITEKATAEGVNSTPTFYLNGEKLTVASWAELEPVLQRMGAR